ncbi:MAG: hypothetical protein L0Y54_13310 [Sporichthyaceae bacterium]|nr:hypothetical protein [Sporichthyaceae bacterium]
MSAAYRDNAVPAMPAGPAGHQAPARSPLAAPVERPRPPLRVVPAIRRRPARTPFVLLVVIVLGAGLVTLLLLNTGLAQDSFELTDLRRQSALLHDREEALEQEIAQLSTPDRLAAEAERLGMRPGTDPKFLRVPTGGVPDSGKGSDR